MFLRRFFHFSPTVTTNLCLIDSIHLTARRLSSTDQESLESKFQALQTALSKQQIALAGLAKKVVNGNDTNVVIETLKTEVETVSSSVVEIQRSVSRLESQMNEMEQEMAKLKKSTNKITSAANTNNNTNSDSSSSSASNSRLLSELVSRISAIESRQAIVKISQKNQQFDNSNNTRKNSNNNAKSADEAILVSMEPGVDGTPRLLTCQVKVFHPTAMVTDIRSLMETAGPVVSCLRKPGESNNNNNNNRGNVSNNNKSASKPCFVVTFQNTIDAARAIENVSGILIRGVAVQVESYLQPEQMLAGNN